MYRSSRQKKVRARWMTVSIALGVFLIAALLTRSFWLPFFRPFGTPKGTFVTPNGTSVAPQETPAASQPSAEAATPTDVAIKPASPSSVAKDYTAEPDPALSAQKNGAKLAPQVLSSYSLDVNVDPESNKMRCTAEIEMVNPSDAAISELLFDLFPNNEGVSRLSDSAKKYTDRKDAGFTLSRALVNSEPVEAEQSGTTIRLPLPFELPAGERVRVLFSYSLDLPMTAIDYGHNSRGINAAWFYPVPAAYTNGVWMAQGISPTGMPLSLEAANYTAAVHVPSAYSISCTGRIVSILETKQRKTYQIEAKGARDFAFHADNRTNRRAADLSGIDLSSRAAAEDKIALMDQYAKQIVPIYSELFGAYPYSSLSIAQTSLWTESASHASLVLMDVGMVQSTSGVFEQALARAIARQWFGCSVSASHDGQWLNDALCEYATIAFIGKKRGPEAAVALYSSRIKTTLPATLPKLKDNMPAENEAQSKANAYLGAAMLYDLSKQMNETAFFTALKSYCETYAHGQGSLRALMNEFIKADPSTAAFFAQRVDSAS